MSMEQARSGAGLTLDPLSNMYYLPKTGQFYNPGVVAPPVVQNPFMGGMIFNQRAKAAPSNALNYGGYTFNPFAGTMDGITGGIFSPIGRFKTTERTYAPPVGILDALFGGFDFSNFGKAADSGQGSGAARFISGPSK